MRLFWTEFAKNELREIHRYYSRKASPQVANRIKSEIFKKVKLLIPRPELGQIELNLESKGLGFRYLVAGNFKVIYKSEGDDIFITDIFDTRRDPEKMKRANS